MSKFAPTKQDIALWRRYPKVFMPQGRRIMFQVFHADGSYQTQYGNQSEAETYFKASFQGAEFDAETKANEGIVVVTDAEGKEVGEIRGPKVDSAKADETGKRSAKRK